MTPSHAAHRVCELNRFDTCAARCSTSDPCHVMRPTEDCQGVGIGNCGLNMVHEHLLPFVNVFPALHSDVLQMHQPYVASEITQHQNNLIGRRNRRRVLTRTSI